MPRSRLLGRRVDITVPDRRLSTEDRRQEEVDHPQHYGGDEPYEVVKVAEAWGLDKDGYLFNVLKYVARMGKKPGAEPVKDLKKARFYLDRRIALLEGKQFHMESSRDAKKA